MTITMATTIRAIITTMITITATPMTVMITVITAATISIFAPPMCT